MKITSYNLHGQSSQLYKLGLIDNNFSYYTVYAMDLRSQCGFLRGCPFGGVGILWRKTFSHIIERISKDTEVVLLLLN